MAFYGRLKGKGFTMPIRDNIKGAISKRSATMSGCTFQPSPETARMESEKSLPEDYFQLDIDIQESASSSVQVKKGSPSSPLSGHSRGGKTFRITQRSEIHKSPSTLSANSPRNIKRSLMYKSSTSSLREGTFHKKQSQKLQKFVSTPSLEEKVFQENSQIEIKMNATFKTERKSQQHPSSPPSTEEVFCGSRCKLNRSLPSREPTSLSSPVGNLNKDPRRSKKRTPEIRKSETSTDEGFHGSKLMQTEELPGFQFSPRSSHDDDSNSDTMISLSPLYDDQIFSSSDDICPGGYRMTKNEPSEFHTDSTSDMLQDMRIGETPTWTMDPITPKGKQKKQNHIKENCACTYDDWMEYKQKQRKEQLQREKAERAAKDLRLAQRKETSQTVYQMWLKKKQRQQAAQRIQSQTQISAPEVSSAPKGSTTSISKLSQASRNRSPDQIKEELKSWRQKKIRMQKAKRQEEELAKIKQDEYLFNRQSQSEMAIKKWFSTVHKKPKPVPLNQGLASLRGSVSKMYVNPQPWVT